MCDSEVPLVDIGSLAHVSHQQTSSKDSIPGTPRRSRPPRRQPSCLKTLTSGTSVSASLRWVRLKATWSKMESAFTLKLWNGNSSAARCEKLGLVVIRQITALHVPHLGTACVQQVYSRQKDIQTEKAHGNFNVLSLNCTNAVLLNGWSLRANIFFPYREVATQIYSPKIKTLAHFLSGSVNKS